MADLAAGDQAALEELLGRHERALISFLDRRTGGRDVEDLFQETWLRVVQAAARFDRSRRFSTWLFQIATNLCRDRWRRSRIEPDDAVARAASDEGRAAVRNEDEMTVARLLDRLSDVHREVVVLRYFHDLSEDEVAEIVGCPRGTVKSRTHNALARLADLAAQERE